MPVTIMFNEVMLINKGKNIIKQEGHIGSMTEIINTILVTNIQEHLMQNVHEVFLRFDRVTS